MAIIEVPVILDSSLQYSHETHQRSDGLHLSTVIASIERNTWGVVKGDGFDSQDLEAYRIGGFLFERAMYENILAHRKLERLGEFEVDGILMTPDAVDLSISTGIETKMTWRSMPTKKNGKTIEDEFATWILQIQGYMKALSVNRWELWAYFVNGGYGADRKPKMRRWDLEYSKEEVEGTWKRIKNHAKWMRENPERVKVN